MVRSGCIVVKDSVEGSDLCTSIWYTSNEELILRDYGCRVYDTSTAMMQVFLVNRIRATLYGVVVGFPKYYLTLDNELGW